MFACITNSDLYTSLMKLNEICEVYSGYAIKEFNNIKNGLPVIKIGNILSDGTLNLGECQFSTEDINEKYHSKKGDIYIALSGATTGKLGIMEDEKKFIINQRVGVIRPKQKSISQSYIKYYLLKQTERIIDEAAGCAQPNISPKQIGEYDVPVFSEKEMLQICNILNKIECVIKYYKMVLEKYDDLIKARFVEMFGDIDNNKYDYDIRCLNDVCEFIKDGTHQTPIYTQDKENGYKFISSKDVVLGSVDWNHLKYIPEDLHKKLYKHISPRRGDILLAKNGTTGIAAMVDRDEVFDIYVSLAILRPLNINSTYLLFAINSNATKRQFDACLKGIGVPNLHLGEIKKTKIIVPPLDKQSDFEKYAIQVDKSKFIQMNSTI